MRRVALLVLVALMAWPAVASAQRRFKARVLYGAASDNLPAPPDVTLTAPSEDATDRSINLSLNYAVSGEACTLATLYLDDVNGQTLFDTDADCSGVFHPGPLEYETIYHWRVKVENDGGSNIAPVRAFTTAAMGERSLLSYADITCVKKFAGINTNLVGGLWAPGQPMTFRTVGGVRHWFQLETSNDHLLEIVEPDTGQDCNTALASVTRVPNYTDWGAGAINGASGVPLNCCGSTAWFQGIGWDEATQRIYKLWAQSYGSMPNTPNTIAAFTLGSTTPDGDNYTGSLARVGCWSINGVHPPERSINFINIPSDFVTDHLGTKRIGIGGGSGGVSPVTTSYGPALYAIDSPTANDCPADTDTPVPSYTTLVRYETNINGPNCANEAGIDIGCTPALAPTPPYPARTGYCGYSASHIPQDWECYAGVGYHNAYSGEQMAWYDDGLKYGILTSHTFVGGWTKGPIVSGSISGVDLTVTMASLSTHDGGILTVGTWAGVETCRVGVDTGCSTTQGGNDSYGIITSVNDTTKTVVVHVAIFDVGSGSHNPVVGGGFWVGEFYTAAEPWYSRGILWSQLYDPADIAAILDDGADLWSPEYYEETSLAAAFSFFGNDFGCPTCTVPGINSYGSNGSAQSLYLQVFADPDAQQIIFTMSKGQNNGGGTYAPVFYVFDVAH